MSRVHDDHTAPGPAPGAVPSDPPVLLGERDFWRAVAHTVLATLRSWPR